MVGMGALAAVGGSLPLDAQPGPASAQMQVAKSAAKKIKIKEVEIYYLDLPLANPFTVALGTITKSNGVLIRIVTDSGITGIGESCPYQPVTGDTQATNIEAALHLKSLLQGMDPLAIEGAHTVFGGYEHSNPSIVAAFDMALYDILGKAAGLPLFRLLGGDKTTFETDWTTGIDTPENMVKNVNMHLAKGYKILKIKLGLDPDLDVARLQAIRDAVGYGYTIRIDANQGYTVPQAMYALRHMEKFKIQCCEQPLIYSDVEGMRRLRQNSPIPIMADESLFSPADAIRLIRADACDYFNIKLMKAGGITNALRISWIAEAADIRCMLGCMFETRIGLTAAAHVHGARKNIVFADLDSFLDFAEDPVLGGMTVLNGMVTLPETPGLGVDIDPSYLKKLKRA
jgi:L-alanine-DL-glutamate epimerase-like enolase superfamily enzyme